MKKAIILFAAVMLGTTVFAQSTWTNDKMHSKLGFTITHLMVSDVDGIFKDFTCTIVAAKPDFSDAKFQLTVNTASKAIKLYPNPVINGQSSRLSIDVSPSELEGARLTITSLSGQVVKQSNILSSDTSISGLQKGSYAIHVTFADGSSYNEKLVIY